ncbi:MAG: GntR family transcriptional regulator [Pseudolactococcus laudensis]|uniref:GntR family transcriptional regulator n=1 Tax=Pseudolactococcus laudensis TaxID=1494461 RepID=UPI003F9E7EA1
MEFKADQPIYLQIMSLIQNKIVSGELKKGDKIPAVRSLALDLSTNPNTVQRALSELEREEIVFSKRGLGRFVTEDDDKIKALKDSEITHLIDNFMTDMQALGLSQEKILTRLQAYMTKLGDKV